MCRICTLAGLSILFCLALSASADDKNKQASSDRYANLHFVVVKDYNSKPVRNASVILHPVTNDGKQAKGGFQLKTDLDGKTETEGIPYGPLRVQVLVSGFQTFGDDYQIDQPDMVITIRLKRPVDQLTVYDKPGNKKSAPPSAPQDNQPHL